MYVSLQAKHTATLSKAYSARTGLYEVSNVCDQDSRPFLLTPPVMQARCDMETDGGGWMVILRRKSDVSSQVNFNRTWTEYENGFGDLNTEFWYGLQSIHCLTARDTVQLQIQLNHTNGTGLTWTYEHFRVHLLPTRGDEGSTHILSKTTKRVLTKQLCDIYIVMTCSYS